MNCVVIGIVICIFFALLAIKTEKKIINPITVFCVLWGMIMILSKVRLYTLYEVDEYTYFLIVLGIIFYILGYYTWKCFSKNKFIRFTISNKHKHSYNYEYQLRYKLMYMLCIVCILFLFREIISLGINNISGDIDLKEIQRLVRTTAKNRSNLENAISFLIVNPFYIALYTITAIDFWIGKRDKKLLLMTLIILVGKVLSSGGREPFIKFFFCMIVGYMFAINTNIDRNNLNIRNILKKNKRLFYFTIFLTVVCLGALSFSRAGENMGKTIYLNFAMQPNMFEYWLEQVESQNLYGYGFASLNGFFYTLLYCLKSLMILPDIPELYSKIYSITMATDSQWIQIGREVFANAYVSVFWFLYFDAREIGIMLGMYLYGLISQWSYSFAINKTSIKSVSIYSIILVGVFYTFGRMEFTTTNYTLGFLFIYFIAYKKKCIDL